MSILVMIYGNVHLKCQSLSSPHMKNMNHINPTPTSLVTCRLSSSWMGKVHLFKCQVTNQPKNRSRLRFFYALSLTCYNMAPSSMCYLWPHHPGVIWNGIKSQGSWAMLATGQVTESWLSGIIDVSRWEKMLFCVIIHLLRFISQTLTLIVLYRVLL